MPISLSAISLALVFVTSVYSGIASAHPFPEPQLQRIDQRLLQFPNAPLLYLQRAGILVTLENFEQALLDLDRAEALGLRSPQLPLARGFVYLQQGSFDLAIEFLSQALALEPELPRALSLRAQAYQQNQQPGLAVFDWQHLLSISSSPSPALFAKAALAAEQAGDHATGLAIIDQGLSQWPLNSALQQESIDALWQQQQYDKAIQRLEAHATAATARPYYWKIQLAEKLLLVGRIAEARRALGDADQWLEQQANLNRGQREIQREIRQRLSALVSPEP